MYNLPVQIPVVLYVDDNEFVLYTISDAGL